MMGPKNPHNTKVIAFLFLKIKSNDWRQKPTKYKGDNLSFLKKFKAMMDPKNPQNTKVITFHF